MFRVALSAFLLTAFLCPTWVLADKFKVADWAAKEIDLEEFEDCSQITNEASLISATGEIFTSEQNQAVFSTIIRSETGKAFMRSEEFRYYILDYSGSTKPDDRHLSVVSPRGLAIRSFVLDRNYETDSIDPPNVVEKAVGTRDFDSFRVLAVFGGDFTPDERQRIDAKLDELAKRQVSFYEKDETEWRMATLRLFKEHTDKTTHKVLKGPFDAKKMLMKTFNVSLSEADEGFGAVEKVGVQFVCYKAPGCVFIDMEKLQDREDRFLYVLFYGDDGTSDLSSPRTTIPGEQDDLLGVVRIPAELLQSVGNRFNYVQWDPSNDEKQIDFIAGFEVVDSSNPPTLEQK